MANLDVCLEEWAEIEKEYLQLEEQHRTYSQKVDEVKALQQKCASNIAHQRYRMKSIAESIRKLERNCTPEDKDKFGELHKSLAKRKKEFREMEDVLPHENGLYLRIILGSVNVSLLSKRDKYKLKDNYENFKLYVTIISMVLACALWFINYRVTDAAFQFLLVWYYCTLTIREHILKVNGSRIKGWWISHHFISTVCAGILLIWPDGFTYHQFREPFVLFSVYLSFVQVCQYYYQKGCLYRLRALGERRNMDISVEGFQSWMWKGLTFLLPFLVGGYVFQLYNAYVLVLLSQHEKCKEWQVPALAVIFFTLFLGNTLTTFAVIRNKVKKKFESLQSLQDKYRFPLASLTNHLNSKLHDS